MAKPKKTIIESGNTYDANQSWFYREIFKQGDFKLRVEIRVNAYDFQSHARIQVWNEANLEWKPLHSIPHSKMESLKAGISYTQPTCSTYGFQADRNALIAMAEKILF
jgi:phage terminase large subunit